MRAAIIEWLDDTGHFGEAANLITSDFVSLRGSGVLDSLGLVQLVVMLEKHGIKATQEFVDPNQPDDGDLNRLANVLVPEEDYDRAYQLFYAEREDEL